jgi:23S rRNA (cytidine1920-2'-O)/16S rRNA (cytidine1409-2'-O)-methyltransferase
MKRVRLDKLLVDRGIETSRERARDRIEQGEVRVGGIVVTRPASQVDPGAHVEIFGDGLQYVSRGGLKLEQAIDAFSVDPTGMVVMDVGASTGGFTDCVLQRGAIRVYAVDVGYGQLAWKLRQDERVIVMERTNIRYLARDAVPENVDLAVIDCSFIGLNRVLAPTAAFLCQGSQVLALVKPQFEVGPSGIGKGGVVRDARIRARAIEDVRELAVRTGFEVLGGVDCDTHGPAGNIEYLMHLRMLHDPPPAPVSEADLDPPR